MNHKIIRLAGRSYVISGFTPTTTKRVITTLRGLNVQELKDIPDAVPVMVDAISIAIWISAFLIVPFITSSSKGKNYREEVITMILGSNGKSEENNRNLSLSLGL